MRLLIHPSRARRSALLTPMGRIDVRESVELRAPKKPFFFVSALLVVLLSFKSKAATFTVLLALHRHFFPFLFESPD
jgi:hypothetical protein